MPRFIRPRLLLDAYRFPGFRPGLEVKGIFGEPGARVIKFTRREKKQRVGGAAKCSAIGTTGKSGESATNPAAICGSTWIWRSEGFTVDGAAR